MTTLPRISPQATTRSAHYRGSSLYGPYPPRELSFAMDVVAMPSRINPIAPNPPRRRINASWETIDQHWHNDKRRTLMQQREHLRYHSAWAKAFYGSVPEKEVYRRHFREVLKKQMDDKDELRQHDLVDKVQESEAAVEYDRECLKTDAEKHWNKRSLMTQYRDRNKELMENRWQHVKVSRATEEKVDREALRYNPINWSATLK